MFIDGLSVGIGLLFLSLLFFNSVNHPSKKLVAGIIVILIWLESGSTLLDHGDLLARLYIASIPVTFFLLLPMIYRYQQMMTAYGDQPEANRQAIHGIPVGLAGLLSLSIGLMPSEDFKSMFFSDTEPHSVWVSINSAGFAFLLIGWTILSIVYLYKIVINTKAYHQQLNNQFADHDGKQLYWLIGFTGLLVLTWLYALLVLGVSSAASTPLISEHGLSLLVLLLIWIFCLQTLNRRPVFSHLAPEQTPDPEAEDASAQKYSNSSIDDERLKRIADKIERKIMAEHIYLNPNIDASTLASELGISVHYLSQVFSQEMHTTFYSYINDARIDAAKEALKTRQQTVLDIALSVGYNTRSSFYNAFKKRTGMTPSQYKAAETSVKTAG